MPTTTIAFNEHVRPRVQIYYAHGQPFAALTLDDVCLMFPAKLASAEILTGISDQCRKAVETILAETCSDAEQANRVSESEAGPEEENEDAPEADASIP